jgi:hypothetical protein
MPKKPYETDNAFGKKLLGVMAEKGMAGDLARLAADFGVTVPSTYDWVKHGRFAKERYARLVEWSGRDLHWWFDVRDDSAAPARTAHEPIAPYGRPPWPFRSPLTEQTICNLAADDLRRIEGALLLVLAQLPAQETARAA